MTCAKCEPCEAAGVIPSYTGPNGEFFYGTNGLTKREYFAACALQGLLSNGLLSEQIIHHIADIPTRIPTEFFGQAAAMYADGLIAELNKGV